VATAPGSVSVPGGRRSEAEGGPASEARDEAKGKDRASVHRERLKLTRGKIASLLPAAGSRLGALAEHSAYH